MAFNAVNTERLLSKISHFFERPEGVLVEIAQNACRAGATKLAITADAKAKTIEAEDNGRGADSIEPLFCLADSAWSEEVEAEQMPAGWGLFYLMAISEKVAYQSRFGYVEVDCEKFLNVTGYRDGMFGLIEPRYCREGFWLHAKLKEGVAEKLLEESTIFGIRFFPMEIIINGNPVERKRLSSMVGSSEAYRTLEYRPGCTVYIRPAPNLFHYGNPEYTLGKMGVVYHGIPIHISPFSKYYDDFIYVDITEGSPLTPVLPYRTAIKLDAKAEEFYEFLRRSVVETVMAEIEKALAGEMPGCDLVRTLKIAREVMSQEELNYLDVWFVRSVSHNDGGSEEARDVIVRKDQTLPANQVPALVENGEPRAVDFVIEDGDLLASVHVAGRAPEWVVIEDEDVQVDIGHSAEPLYFNYRWQKADRIMIGDTPVTALCTDDDYHGSGIIIYYTDSPKDVWNIFEQTFVNFVRNEDGDTWETQRTNFEQDITDDVQKLTGVYEVAELLKGLWAAGVSPLNVVTLNMAGDGTIKIGLRDGSETTLTLAA